MTFARSCMAVKMAGDSGVAHAVLLALLKVHKARRRTHTESRADNAIKAYQPGNMAKYIHSTP